MATRKKTEPAQEQPKEAAAVAQPKATPPKPKIGKLVKKDKKRLPRKEKKKAKKKLLQAR
jgi:hypothetical protein